MKAQPTEWEKDATNYMTNKWLTKHINNSYYSIKKKTQPNLKNGQKIGMDIFPKKKYRWQKDS